MLSVLLHELVELDPTEFVAVFGILGNPDDCSLGYLQAADHLAVPFDLELEVGLSQRSLRNRKWSRCVEPYVVLRHWG